MNTDSAYQAVVTDADSAGSLSTGAVFGGLALAIVLVVRAVSVLEKIMGRER